MTAPAMRERPDAIVGTTYAIESGNGKLFVTVNHDEKGMFEVFAHVGKSGGFTSSFTEAIGRLISLALRSGVDPLLIAKQLVGIRSPKHGMWLRTPVYSIPDAIGQAMLKSMGKHFTDPKPADLAKVPEDPQKEPTSVVVDAEDEDVTTDKGEEQPVA